MVSIKFVIILCHCAQNESACQSLCWKKIKWKHVFIDDYNMCIYFFKRNYYSKIFGCLHNGLSKLLKKPEKKIKPDKCECQSEIDIKIKCSTIRGKNSDPYLKVNIIFVLFC